jgi:hypothetical protein
MLLVATNRSCWESKKNNANVQIIFVCIVKKHAMLLVNVQKSVNVTNPQPEELENKHVQSQ